MFLGVPQRVLPLRLAVLDPAGGGSFPPASACLRTAACAAGAAGPGRHGRRPAVPAPAAPLPAARRCRQRRPPRLQPAPQPGGDLPHQPGGRRPGCALGPGPARPRGVAAGAGEAWGAVCEAWGGRCLAGVFKTAAARPGEGWPMLGTHAPDRWPRGRLCPPSLPSSPPVVSPVYPPLPLSPPTPELFAPHDARGLLAGHERLISREGGSLAPNTLGKNTSVRAHPPWGQHPLGPGQGQAPAPARGQRRRARAPVQREVRSAPVKPFFLAAGARPARGVTAASCPGRRGGPCPRWGGRQPPDGPFASPQRCTCPWCSPGSRACSSSSTGPSASRRYVGKP